MLTPVTAVAGCFLLLITIIVASTAVLRQAGEVVVRPSRRARLALAGAFAAVLVLIVASKLSLVSQYGSSVPFLDQWNGEGAIYQALAHGTLRWVNLTEPHNEHRIAVGRLWHLGLLVVNGQWDALVQTSANALLHGWTAVLLGTLLWRQFGGKYLDVICALLLVAWALPFNWENTLAGFQAQFYFLVLFLILPLALLPDAGPSRLRWWIAVALLVLALFSAASGFLNAVVVAVALALRRVAGHTPRDDFWPSFAACVAVTTLGTSLMVGNTDAPSVTATEFGDALLAWLAWPYPEHAVLAWIPWMPLVALVGRWMVRKGAVSTLDVTLLALGAWVVFHGVAISYARGSFYTAPASRYTDILSLGLVANGVALVALVAQSKGRPVRSALAVVAVAWVAYVGLGVSWRTQEALELGAPGRGEMHRQHARNLRSFLATGDLGTLRLLPFPGDTPFPSADVLADVLLDPAMRRWWPPSLRVGLPIVAEGHSAAFVRNGAYPTTPVDPTRPSWGSYGPSGNGARGTFESQTLECSASRYLMFEIAGYLGASGTKLAVVQADAPPAYVRPREPSRERWLRYYMRCPAGPFAIAATDDTPDWWFAFRPPVEIGRLAFVAYPLIDAWRALMLGGGVLVWLGVRFFMSTTRAAFPREGASWV